MHCVAPTKTWTVGRVTRTLFATTEDRKGAVVQSYMPGEMTTTIMLHAPR
jgi:hypothetical protein